MSLIKIGHSFLHQHQDKEKRIGLDDNHVIVDRVDWELIVKFFEKNPDLTKYLYAGEINLKIKIIKEL